MKFCETFDSNIIVSTHFANYLGLDSYFFSQRLRSQKKFNPKFKIFKVEKTVMIQIPLELGAYMDKYTPVVLNRDDDEKEMKFVIKLNHKLKIGFWK